LVARWALIKYSKMSFGKDGDSGPVKAALRGKRGTNVGEYP